MGTPWLQTILLCWGYFLLTLFIIFGAIGICYAFFTVRLARHIKVTNLDLWGSLGKLGSFKFFSPSVVNRALDTRSQFLFCKWFYAGGDGVKDLKTIALVQTTRKLCRTAIMLFIGLNIALFLTLGIALLVLVMKGYS